MAVSETIIDQWTRWLRAAGRPESTIALRSYHVTRTFREVNASPWRVTTEQLVEWLASKNWAAETRRSYRSSLRSFYAWALAAGLVEESPAHWLPPVKVPRARPRPAPEYAFTAALAVADDRARLAIMLAGFCGLRRGEIARARREDLEVDLVGESLRVVGKGGHVRLVPLPDVLADEIGRREDGWLFPSPRGGHLTPHHLGKVVAAHLPEGLTTHTLRHRCATVAYAGSRDLRAVQELLGHARPETTASYTAVPDDAVRAAMMHAAG